jgi:hypothetical protein
MRQDPGRTEESIRTDLNECAPEIVGKVCVGAGLSFRGEEAKILHSRQMERSIFLFLM